MTRKYWLLYAIATAVSMSVSAQQADEGAELEEIVVTGSYLFTGLDSPSLRLGTLTSDAQKGGRFG